MNIQDYINEVRALHASGQTTEHSFRPALAKLFGSIDPSLTVINEPKHITEVGAPDFVFNRGDVAIGWCEAKDIGKDIRNLQSGDYSKEQKDRYRKGLPNLIYTNGLDFEFIREGAEVDFITIADLVPTLPARRDAFPALENRLRDFASATPLSVTSSKRLAQMMAGKAAIIKDIIGRALAVDAKEREQGGDATDLIGQYEAFKTSLIHDITVEEFADIYAETIAYGLFAARLHDQSPATFTRAEALELLPKSNPFLRELFIYIAGPNLDERLRRVIDELCNVFCATNMEKVLANFGKVTAQNDPFLHFYEVFLASYNPAKRKARGVWYTPEPVVNFIVRAVDEVLKTEFNLADGLADTSRITVDWDTGQNGKDGKPATIKKQVHRVQILDPATGTGTFLAEAVKLVSERVKGIAPGQWSAYVEQDLIPRVHGFELLMASYAMCHMKLDMILTGLGYKPSARSPRLGVYLTNSLEEGERVEQTLFGLSRAIAVEAKAANDIKRQSPIMCVIGNPPYSGVSQNNGAWITAKIEDYKYVDGIHFGERKHWLQDDYVKFIRFAEHMIQKNGEGIIGFITNHGYLDNPTFRGMRAHLLNTFDKIFVLDLHGNSLKKETSPDGSPDKNVFDIMPGVAIIIAIKRKSDGKKLNEMAVVLRGDIWGERASKYDTLWSADLPKVCSERVAVVAPQYPFENRDASLREGYDAGFSLKDFWLQSVTGMQTGADGRLVHEDRARLIENLTAESGIPIPDRAVTPISYRPFDARFAYYSETLTSNDDLKVCTPASYRSRGALMRNMWRNNLALLAPRQLAKGGYRHAFITDIIPEMCLVSNVTKEQNVVFPLYLYPEDGTLDSSVRTNFDPKLYARFCKAAGLRGARVIPEGTDGLRLVGDARPDEIKVFDYIYGVLHSPRYREIYREFLKVDFPRIPYPKSSALFEAVSAQGERLRRLHLMESEAVGDAPYAFHGDGDSVVERISFDGARVWINSNQYFGSVPPIAWTFLIGSYHPAQKWLKDRRGRALSWNDIRHYQKIIKILVETDRVMDNIEMTLP
ncbi:type ISP restriction/modification enzyme [Sphingomonas sp. LY160]|uniref:type ISP restriction/modification enzyme n=1 Tax=Sphingomonas sp. LY160 TaxID=3095342 RepID=UPI002ADEC4EE|nr:type ISP restriction/modification enzyme [Sphingomonas sp. LY160]MEA1071081.1 type ISP restriction/modification enzyme [Sphingomonas sp. LY160]